jgi:hypothetical protein
VAFRHRLSTGLVFARIDPTPNSQCSQVTRTPRSWTRLRLRTTLAPRVHSGVGPIDKGRRTPRTDATRLRAWGGKSNATAPCSESWADRFARAFHRRRARRRTLLLRPGAGTRARRRARGGDRHGHPHPPRRLLDSNADDRHRRRVHGQSGTQQRRRHGDAGAVERIVLSALEHGRQPVLRRLDLGQPARPEPVLRHAHTDARRFQTPRADEQRQQRRFECDTEPDGRADGDRDRRRLGRLRLGRDLGGRQHSDEPHARGREAGSRLRQLRRRRRQLSLRRRRRNRALRRPRPHRHRRRDRGAGSDPELRARERLVRARLATILERRGLSSRRNALSADGAGNAADVFHRRSARQPIELQRRHLQRRAASDHERYRRDAVSNRPVRQIEPVRGRRRRRRAPSVRGHDADARD